MEMIKNILKYIGYHIWPGTFFIPRLTLFAFVLALPPIFIRIFFGEGWTKEILEGGIYVSTCVAILSFLIKYEWETSRRRYNALVALSQEILLQITTLCDMRDKIDYLVGENHPALFNPCLVEPNLDVLKNVARVELKNKAFQTLSRIPDLKFTVEGFAKMALEEAEKISQSSALQEIVMNKMKAFRKIAESHINSLTDIGLECEFFIKNDAPFWRPTLPYYSQKKLMRGKLKREKELEAELEEINKRLPSPEYL